MKLERIAQGHIGIEICLKENLDEASIMSKFGKEIVTLDVVVAAYQHEGHGRTSSVLIAKAFCRIDLPAQRRVSTKGGRRNLISLVNHDRWGAAENDEWGVRQAHAGRDQSLMAATDDWQGSRVAG